MGHVQLQRSCREAISKRIDLQISVDEAIKLQILRKGLFINICYIYSGFWCSVLIFVHIAESEALIKVRWNTAAYGNIDTPRSTQHYLNQVWSLLKSSGFWITILIILIPLSLFWKLYQRPFAKCRLYWMLSDNGALSTAIHWTAKVRTTFELSNRPELWLIQL